jgi:RNA 2',3'-cyclic 3'-phosphodiesterase
VADRPRPQLDERPHRLFVAVPLPAGSLAAAEALIDGVRAGPLGLVPRWVHTANLHLTVRFLGETPPDLVPDAALAVRDAIAAAGVKAFDVVLAHAGAFPAARKPRALWLGIEEGAGELGRLARALDPALEPLGWPPDDRPYRPHLTVARLDSASIADGGAIAETLRHAADHWRTSFRADTVVLYRSHLGGGPPRYEPLVQVQLSPG